MRGTAVYVFLAVVLVVGLAVGYGITAWLTPGSGEVRNATLQVGDEAPDFRLMDHTGRYIRLSDFRGDSNVVIAFYPLAWTPV